MDQQVESDSLRCGSFCWAAITAVGRVVKSLFDGLWQSTQYSTLLRRPPWSGKLDVAPVAIRFGYYLRGEALPGCRLLRSR